MMKNLYRALIGIILTFGLVTVAWGTVTTYQYKDNNGSTFNIQLFQCINTPVYCTAMVLQDSSGSEKLTSGNPGNVAGAASSFADGWNVTEGTKADSAWVSGSGSLVSIVKAIANNTGGATPAGSNNIGSVQILGHAGGNLDGTAGSPTTQVLTVQGVSGGTAVPASADPCAYAVKTNFAIGSSSGNIQVVAGSSSKKVYVCSISIIAASTAVINLIEGTGGACTTANEAAVIGSTTAGNGMSLPANGGFTLGNGGGTVAVTATAANGICILQSGTTPLAGNITYIQQ